MQVWSMKVSGGMDSVKIENNGIFPGNYLNPSNQGSAELWHYQRETTHYKMWMPPWWWISKNQGVKLAKGSKNGS